MMKTEYRLRGISNPKSGTLELLSSDKHTFWATFDMPKDRYDALFNWAKSDDCFWKDHAWIAVVEHEKIAEDGCPYGNQRIIEIKEWDLPYKAWDRI